MRQSTPSPRGRKAKLKAIRDFFDQALRRDEARPGQGVEVATAALLVEVMRMDEGADAAGREVALRVVRGRFDLAPDEAERLVALAEEEARGSDDCRRFVSAINQRLSCDERVRVVGLVREVARADASLSVHEEHLIRKIADLLHVARRDCITAKLAARDATAGAGPGRETRGRRLTSPGRGCRRRRLVERAPSSEAGARP